MESILESVRVNEIFDITHDPYQLGRTIFLSEQNARKVLMVSNRAFIPYARKNLHGRRFCRALEE
jgi:ABC-type branched-subunit amino acid transport system ATPase component